MNLLDKALSRKLEANGDKFLPGPEYVGMWHYPELDPTGSVPFH